MPKEVWIYKVSHPSGAWEYAGGENPLETPPLVDPNPSSLVWRITDVGRMNAVFHFKPPYDIDMRESGRLPRRCYPLDEEEIQEVFEALVQKRR